MEFKIKEKSRNFFPQNQKNQTNYFNLNFKVWFFCCQNEFWILWFSKNKIVSPLVPQANCLKKVHPIIYTCYLGRYWLAWNVSSRKGTYLWYQFYIIIYLFISLTIFIIFPYTSTSQFLLHLWNDIASFLWIYDI